MTVLRNNFDGGSAGTDITAGNSAAGGNAFDGVIKTGSGVVKYESSASLNRPTAEFVARMATTTPTGVAVCYWTTSMGSQSQIWMRLYVHFTDPPTTSSSGYPVFFLVSNSSDVAMVSIGVVNNTNEVFVLNGNQASLLNTSGSITVDEWFRIEARFQFSATTGNGEVYWFDEADSPVPTETLSFTNWNLTSSTSAAYYIGYSGTATNQEDLYLSGVELNNTGLPGPAPFRPGKGVPGILTNPIAIHSDVG